MAVRRRAKPVSLGFSSPLIIRRFITDTNSLLLSSPSSGKQEEKHYFVMEMANSNTVIVFAYDAGSTDSHSQDNDLHVHNSTQCKCTKVGMHTPPKFARLWF